MSILHDIYICKYCVYQFLCCRIKDCELGYLHLVTGFYVGSSFSVRLEGLQSWESVFREVKILFGGFESSEFGAQYVFLIYNG
ncbi:hypothetical protein Avbf_03179 [Armadillidium vulgare]|nr:hypothetical protein Avbf_03179 [Armadillidium vulgare]